MQTLGEYFKEERKKKGIALKEIEDKTKISAQILKFIEEDQLDMLPPRAFLRGFLQVIAKEFDMDAVELIKHMEQTLGPYDQPKKESFRYRKTSRWKTPVFIFIIILLFILLMVFLSLCRSSEASSLSNLTDCLATEKIFVQTCNLKTKDGTIAYQDHLTKIKYFKEDNKIMCSNKGLFLEV
ncbi:MAG: helix-turn-helix domain-containing protein [Thermodesulfobacteriota bacterium]|nr:helix-turn-helix domain-containing protein [Thermodesulfobacteriota bacterium]